MSALTRTVGRALLAISMAGSPALAQEETAGASPLQAKIEATLAEHNCSQADVDAIVERLGGDGKAAILSVYRGESDNLPAIPSGDVQADAQTLQASVDFTKCLIVKDGVLLNVASEIRTIAENAPAEHPQREGFLQFAQVLANGIELQAARVAAQTSDKEAGKVALEEARSRVIDVVQAEQAGVASGGLGLPNLEGN